MKKHGWLYLIRLWLVVVAAGCTGGGGGGQTDGETTPGPSAVVSGEAAVTSVTALLLESVPIQVNVIARGNVPDACTSIDTVEQAREGNTFTVTLTTTRLADAACAAALTSFEQVIA